MKSWQTVIASALALSLTACALGAGTEVGDGVSWRFAIACNADAEKLVKSANWSKAETVNLKILAKEYETGFEVNTDMFDPQFMTIKKGHPYILKVNNTDKVSHSLAGNDFFTDMAIAKIVNAGRESTQKCTRSVTVASENWAEIHFVAAKSGRYELEDNAVILMPGLGPVAFIRIE